MVTAPSTRRESSRSNDPLDAAGTQGPNPLTGKAYSIDRMRWAAKWMRFPLYSDKAKLRALTASIRDNQVTVVVSGTGSGKTVLAVPLVLRHVLASGRPPTRVAITIPKRILVQAAASTGAMTLDVAVGAEVGYLYRGSPRSAFSEEKTRVLYATDGTLLAQSRKDPMLSAYAAIIVDEAHERPVPTDMLLLAIRGALKARPELRLVIMSATIDPKPFVDYFKLARVAVDVVQVSGAAIHPIEVRFEPPSSPGSDPLETGIAAVKRVEAETPPPAPLAVLLFVPTTKDATGGCRRMLPPQKKQLASVASSAVACAPLYGKMTDEAKEAILGESALKSRPPRMLFVSTNVAESSLTVEGITHVIDTGLQLTSRWDAAVHGATIERGMASRAQITQRIGRTGRTAPGVAVLLYSKSTFEALPMFPPPAILTVDVTEHILAALARPSRPSLADAIAEMGSMITPPSEGQLAGAAAFLSFYGLVAAKKPTRASPPPPPPPPLPPLTTGGGTRRVRDARPIKSSGEKAEEAHQPPKAPPNAKAPAPGKSKHATGDIKLDHPLIYITELGLWVQRACDELKLSVWNALLPCFAASAFRRCGRELVDLALLFETCGGELSTLLLSPDFGAAVNDEERNNIIRSYGVPGSDHLGVLRILREFVRPMVDGEKAKSSPTGSSTSTKRRATNEALVRAGLNPSTWRSVIDRLRRDGGHAMRFVKHASSVLSPTSIPKHLRQSAPRASKAGTTKSANNSSDRMSAFLISAIASTRMYHLVDCTTSSTVHPERKVRVDADPAFSSSSLPPKSGFFVCEQLSAAGGLSPRWRAEFITRVTTTHASHPAASVPEKKPARRPVGPQTHLRYL